MKPAITPRVEALVWVMGLIQCTPPEFRGPPRDLQPPALSQELAQGLGGLAAPSPAPL